MQVVVKAGSTLLVKVNVAWLHVCVISSLATHEMDIKVQSPTFGLIKTSYFTNWCVWFSHQDVFMQNNLKHGISLTLYIIIVFIYILNTRQNQLYFSSADIEIDTDTNVLQQYGDKNKKEM